MALTILSQCHSQEDIGLQSLLRQSVFETVKVFCFNFYSDEHHKENRISVENFGFFTILLIKFRSSERKKIFIVFIF